jgi:hypothetical protein
MTVTTEINYGCKKDDRDVASSTYTPYLVQVARAFRKFRVAVGYLADGTMGGIHLGPTYLGAVTGHVTNVVSQHDFLQ